MLRPTFKTTLLVANKRTVNAKDRFAHTHCFLTDSLDEVRQFAGLSHASSMFHPQSWIRSSDLLAFIQSLVTGLASLYSLPVEMDWPASRRRRDWLEIQGVTAQWIKSQLTMTSDQRSVTVGVRIVVAFQRVYFETLRDVSDQIACCNLIDAAPRFLRSH